MVETLKEIRDYIAEVTHETQINSPLDNFVNLSLQEINFPAWANNGNNHDWSFLKRKYTLTTVANTEFYQLPRDVDKISLIRQTTSPNRLKYYSDDVFYRCVPNPTATGNPLAYRLWEEEGISTRLSAAGTIDVISAHTSDTGGYSATVVGKDSNGIIQSEVLTMNGTTKVTGSQTFSADYPIRISKSTTSNGNWTFTTGSTTILVLGKEERSARFKVIGFYPIPSSAISIYIEYYTRIRRLVNSTDTPDIEEKFIPVLIQGTLSKVFQYQKKTSEFIIANNDLYKNALKGAISSDRQNVDDLPHLRSMNRLLETVVELSDDIYGLTY